MKKKLIVATLAVLTSGIAQADFLRIEAGAGLWQSEPSGTITDKASGNSDTLNASDQLGYQEENISYLWLNVKHPIPLLPNVRLEYVTPSFEGNTKKSFTWAGDPYSINTNSKLELQQTDIVLYYNLLDNTFWATLDLGLDLKLIDYSYELRNASNAYSDSASLPIPMLYARTRAQIPMTNIGLEADIKFIGYGDTQLYDFRAKVDYTFDYVPVIQPAIELGYRTQKFKIDEDGEDTKIDFEFSGIYGGVMLRF
ncbi:MAG TPA: TIGR04219 family outer membrane beta-barrel protein [Gammaproteobacteria bacterium]|nr:TIGR04219 family outer membrane beta-barrel protein [Gammaproteobacteria bacterium]